jgi:predicted metalloendopeptidase
MDFNLSTNFTPQTDFYKHVNNNWLSKTNIPNDEQIWGVFNEINEENQHRVRNMIENYKGDNNLFNNVKLLFYQCMRNNENTESARKLINQKGFLNEINKVNNLSELDNLIFNYFRKYGIGTPISYFVYNDFNNSDRYILHVSSGGLGLPDRDYYFDEEKAEIRDKYKEFMKNYMKLFDIKIDCESVYKLEEIFAKNTYTNVEKRDPHLRNNMFTYESFKDRYPNSDVLRFFESLDVIPNDINVLNPKFLSNSDMTGYYNIINTISIDVLKDYYTWLYCRKLGTFLNKETYETIFDFYSRTISGTPLMKPSWKRCIDTIDSLMGMGVAKMFVDKYFTSESKNKVDEMVSFIKEQLKNSIETNNWMENITKKKALEKLNKMNYKIGYPDKWQDLKNIQVNTYNSFLQNVLSCMKFENDYDDSFLYKKKDISLWFMNPHEVNAYYSPSYNEIVFPAGILQPPFFSKDYDMAVNFGAIGTVIGHEITHGFDDQGRKYDKNGNLNDWWTDMDTEKYRNETDKLRKLFSSFTLEDKYVNGDLTLGENIADLGGLSISLKSLKKYLDMNPSENIIINNQSPYERFFMSYANIWKCKTRKKESIKRLITDPHSPPCYRVNGIVVNMPEYYQVFNLNPSSDLWLEESKRTNIW